MARGATVVRARGPRVRQRSSIPSRSASPDATSGQRGWKRQPAGIRVGSGASPCRICCSICSISGTTESSARVYGMPRVREHLLGRPLLDDPPEVHHRDPVGDVPREPEVVRDDEDRDARSRTSSSMSARISPRTEASRLETGSSATISHGSQRHRAGDHDPLALPARELVRVALQKRSGGRRPAAGERVRDARRLVARRPCGCAAPRRPPRRSSGAG